MSSEIQLPSGDTDPLIQSAVLADSRHRRILSLLSDQSTPLTERDLAVQLAAQETEQPPSEMDEEDHHHIRMDLYHHCLPKLEAAGWIERHPEGIVTTEQLSFKRIEASLPDIDTSDVSAWKALAVLLAHPRRHDVVSTIADRNRPLSLDELGTALTVSEQATWTANEGNDSTLLATLHHVDLPKLEEVGLIDYDSDEKTITQHRFLRTLVDQTVISRHTTEETDTNS